MSEKIITKSNTILYSEKKTTEDHIQVSIRLGSANTCLLHWGLCRNLKTPWQIPPKQFWPKGSRAIDQKALQTPFLSNKHAKNITISIPHSLKVSFLEFALYFPADDRWDNNDSQNYQIMLQRPSVPPIQKLKAEKAINDISFEDSHLKRLADDIISKEMSPNSWTLMHRFNLCYDLLDRVNDHLDGLALLFVWLRFSAIRQLDWQRNYNTKPRELAHSLDRLTIKLADLYTPGTVQGEYIRLILTTLGRGAEGQKVRDEILNIMHRHHIKEVSGHFLEEWHQKLHNNTTPDDIVICEAYLAFLRHDGNRDLFYKTLGMGGVSKQRLRSYERPIRSKPDFIPNLKDALIYDFNRFLRILKALHSGTDLEAAIQASEHLLDDGTRRTLYFIWEHHRAEDMDLCDLVQQIVEVRLHLDQLIRDFDDGRKKRDILFLDLAFEAFLRAAVERNLHKKPSFDQHINLVTLLLKDLCLTYAHKELPPILIHWERLIKTFQKEKHWSLHAEAILTRIERVLSTLTDAYCQMLQPKAITLGKAFNAEPWTITMFSEEAARGRPWFTLSVILRKIHPILRKTAAMGKWQVISRGHGTGWIEVVSDLMTVQGRRFTRPTIIITDHVAGEEEIPHQVTAIITSDITDILSHIAIRCRNAHLLFATCYDPETVHRLQSIKGQLLSLRSNTAGDVVIEAVQEESEPIIQPLRSPPLLQQPVFTNYAIPMSGFDKKVVGAKSYHLVHLQSILPEWVLLPRSMAVPFCVFENILEKEINKPISEKHASLSRLPTDEIENPKAQLESFRKSIMELQYHEAFQTSFLGVMNKTGFISPEKWETVWSHIKYIWSSKWNERAYFSRKTFGINHNDIFMSVLVQEVVHADYAFVIHTVNPLTDNPNELYAEVVLGLGETLVGNYQGRALGFICHKKDLRPRIVSFPSKSIALYGGDLIFRSDSNGEDLQGYSGAGLYDSVIHPLPKPLILDYSKDPLLWDSGFQNDLLKRIAQIGVLIENGIGTPQDIEGAISSDQYYVVQSRPQV